MMKLNKSAIFNIFFIAILAILIYSLLKIIYPFFSPIFVALVLALLYYPINIHLRKKGFNDIVSAAIATLAVFITIIIPITFFSWNLLKESKELYPKTLSYLNNNQSLELTIQLPSLIKSETLDFKEIALKNVEQIQNKIVNSGAKILKNVFFFLVDFFVMLFTLFFIFKDGDRFLKWMVELLPMDNAHIYMILNQFYLTVKAIAKGVLLTASIQGIIAGVGYYIAGISSTVLLGTMTAFSAMIPFVGTSLIWAPVAIGAFFFKSKAVGIFIAIWGFFVVSLLDNFLRPILIGRETKIPFFLLFIGLFGGLRIYGPMGLFVGPILVSMVSTFLDIYREQLKNKNQNN